jgi:hypothetical protein
MNAIDASAPQPRPVLVWIICTIYAIGAFGAFVSLYAVFSGALRLPAREAQFYGSFTFINFVGVGLSAVLGLASLIQLFRMRRSAPYLITAGFLVGLIKQLWYRPELTRLGHGLVLPLISQIIALLIVFYSWRLLRRGLLR